MATEQITPGEIEKAVEHLEVGDEITIVYDSAHTDGKVEKSGEVFEIESAEESWSGDITSIKFKNNDGHYRITSNKDTDGCQFVRLQYEWQEGERRRLSGTRRVTKKYGDGVYHIEIPEKTDSDNGSEVNGESVEMVGTQEGFHTFEVGEFRVTVEEYNDAEGGYVAAGGKYVTEQTLNEIQSRLGIRVDP